MRIASLSIIAAAAGVSIFIISTAQQGAAVRRPALVAFESVQPTQPSCRCPRAWRRRSGSRFRPWWWSAIPPTRGSTPAASAALDPRPAYFACCSSQRTVSASGLAASGPRAA